LLVVAVVVEDFGIPIDPTVVAEVLAAIVLLFLVQHQVRTVRQNQHGFLHLGLFTQ
jgi:hypothetical protein